MRTPVKSLRFLKPALVALVVGIFLLIALGGLVRNAGAGLSCPDWPLCFGHVVPPMNVQVFLEWFHRLVAGSLGIVLLAVSIYVFVTPALRARLGVLCALALALLAAQIVLGGLTVIGLLSPKWVTSHLAVGLAFFATLLMIALRAYSWDKAGSRKATSQHRGLASAAFVVVYLQAILGGLVSSNYAGLACPDFPTCFGAWVPPFEGLVKFQFLHRLGACVATIAVLGLFAATRRRTTLAWALPALLSVQIFLGVGSVIWQLPLPMSVAHLAVAALLLATTLVIRYELR